MSASAAAPPPAPEIKTGSTVRGGPTLEKQRGSRDGVLWSLIKVLGSLQLALFLLGVIAVACAIATFYEAGMSRAIVKHYIYNAPWFVFWLALLCINLFAVTLTRWPWQKKHTGFVVTHYSIIVLLTGAMIGMHFGFEGNVTLRKDQPPTDRITTSQSIVQLEDPNSFALFIKPFDASVLRMSPERPRILPVPGTDWRIEVLQFAPDLVREPAITPAPSGTAAGPALLIEMHSDNVRSSQTYALASSASDSRLPSRADFFGMAQILWLPRPPEFQETLLSETQVAFARYQPVSEGTPTGVRINPSADGRTVRIEAPGAAPVVFTTNELIGRPVTIGNAQVHIMEYWPDFEIADGRPHSRSSEPNNPALLARITVPQHKTGDGQPSPWPDQGLALTLAPESPSPSSKSGNPAKSEAQFRFWLTRDGQIQTTGTISLNQTNSTGWNDWTFTVRKFFPQGLATENVRPSRPEVPAEKTGIPGFLAVLNTGDLRGEPTWVESGRVTTLAAGHRFVRLGYGLKLHRVPFTIRLVDFQVPRFEGTDSPSNFIATVEFRDKATGETQQGIAKMNSPASWPGGLWPLITGLNYKFSQAEWNPRDLSETTLQVLYDPGWLLKWIGSLGICVGIAIMFFVKSHKRQDRLAENTPPPSTPRIR